MRKHMHTWREGLKHTRDSDEYSLAVFCKKATIISSEKKLNKPDCNQTESHQNMALGGPLYWVLPIPRPVKKLYTAIYLGLKFK